MRAIRDRIRSEDEAPEEVLPLSHDLTPDDAHDLGQTTNGRLGDDLDVVAGDLLVPLGAALADTLSSTRNNRNQKRGRNSIRRELGSGG